MRTLIIEVCEPGTYEIEQYLTKSIEHLTLLIDFGMDALELSQVGTTEFLSAGGAQYRVSQALLGSFVQSKVGNV